MKSVKNNTGANKKNTAKTASKTTAKTARNTAKSTAKTNINNKEKKDEKMEYVNIHGLKALQYGEIINTASESVNVTAVNIALQAVRIKRDHINAEIPENTFGEGSGSPAYNYLNKIDGMLKYAWQYINKYGEVTNFDCFENSKERNDALDAIEDAKVILQAHNGEKYTQEIQKEARNAVGKKWTFDREHKSNTEHTFTISLDEQKENNGDVLEHDIISFAFDNGDDGSISNIIIKALNKCCSDSLEKEIFLRNAIDGVSVRTISEEYNLSKSAVDRKIQKIKKSMQELLVYNTHTCKAQNK